MIEWIMGLKTGDTVILSRGIYGSVVSEVTRCTESTVWVKGANGSEVAFRRSGNGVEAGARTRSFGVAYIDEATQEAVTKVNAVNAEHDAWRRLERAFNSATKSRRDMGGVSAGADAFNAAAEILEKALAKAKEVGR